MACGLTPLAFMYSFSHLITLHIRHVHNAADNRKLKKIKLRRYTHTECQKNWLTCIYNNEIIFIHGRYRHTYITNKPIVRSKQSKICTCTACKRRKSWSSINTPTYYSGGSGYKSWSGDRLQWLRFSWLSSVTPDKCRDRT
jgi:hypothetical protein